MIGWDLGAFERLALHFLGGRLIEFEDGEAAAFEFIVSSRIETSPHENQLFGAVRVSVN